MDERWPKHMPGQLVLCLAKTGVIIAFLYHPHENNTVANEDLFGGEENVSFYKRCWNTIGTRKQD